MERIIQDLERVIQVLEKVIQVLERLKGGGASRYPITARARAGIDGSYGGRAEG